MEGGKLEKMKIFSGKSHPVLAKKICQQLGVSLSPLKIEDYANGCFEVILKDDVRNKIVFLVQTSSPDFCDLHGNLWELFQMIDAALKCDTKEVIVVMPYVSYARSDKVYTPGMTISGELLVRLLEITGMRRFIGIDFHSRKFGEFFSKETKLYHLSALPLITEYLKKRNLENTILLPGDQGALKNIFLLVKELSVPFGTVEKKRISDTEVKIEKIKGEFSGKNVIILDDEISAGTTVKALGKELESRGIKSLSIAVTHGVFVREAIENLQKLEMLKEIIVTDTVPIPRVIKQALPMKILSIAGLLAKTIKEISEEN